MRKWCRGLWVVGTCVFLVGVGCSAQRGADYPQALSAPRDLSEQDAPVHITSLRFEYQLDERGNWSEHLTQSYRILNRQGVDDWGSTGIGWSPWYMARPLVSASVRDPDGAENRLDPKTLVESAAYPNLPDVYSDRRLLRAPLPGVRVGSLVTESLLRKTTKPFFSGGSAFEIPFQASIARDAVELVIEMPDGMPFNYEILDAKVERNETVQNGRRRVVFKGGPYPAIKSIDDYAPSNLPEWPSVAFSTGRSWQQIATAYSQVVGEKLANQKLGDLAQRSVREADTALQKANKLLAQVRQRVRYAAVEFGQAAIIPALPSQTLERAYGDCKDQALLLVGLLRAAGLPAKIALLRTGPGEDVRPRLPALDVFNHAIVVVPGQDAIWIDPTATYARAGELPEDDQGRLALIIDDDTAELTQTPVSAAKDNTYLEVREVRLQEFGPASVRESSVASGGPEQRLRSSFSGTKEAQIKTLTDYVNEVYAAEKLSNSRYGNPEDLVKPFEIELEASGAKIGHTDVVAANVSIGYGVLYSWLPRPMFDDKERKVDLVLPFPYRAEVRYRLVPPKHFVPVRLPASSNVKLGPAQLNTSYQQKDDGSLEARFSLEIDKRQLNTKDLEAFRKAVDGLQNDSSESIEFEHVGQREIEARQSVKGIATFRRLAEQEPQAYLPLLRFALNLSDMGFGQAARETAQRAVKLAPDSAVAHRTLGIILERDVFGRQLKLGYDRDGAIAAYARAAELNADDTYSKVQAALLLEYDSAGRRYWNPADLRRAVERYDAIPQKDLAEYENGTYRSNALFALVYSEQFDELRRRLSKLKTAEIPAGLALSVAAADASTVQAINEADRLGLRGEQRSEAFATAGDTLYRLGRYREASELFGVAAGASEHAAKYTNRARLLQGMTRVSVEQLKADRPEAVVKKMLLSMIAADKFDANVANPLLSTRMPKEMANAHWKGLSGGMRTAEMPSRFLVDVTGAMFKANVDGSDATGYRVRVTLSAPGALGPTTNYHVVRENGRYAVRAIEADAALGCEAMYQLQQRNVNAARQWLGWAKESIKSEAGDDPLRSPPFLRLWADGKGQPELAAAALCSEDSDQQKALEALLAAREKPGADLDAIDHAIAQASLQSKEHQKALLAIERLEKTHPNSRILRNMKLSALSSLRRFDAYEKIVSKALEAHKQQTAERTELLTQLAWVHTWSGRLKEARQQFQNLVEQRLASASTYNDLAWNGLFTGAKPEEMLNHALQAAQMSSFKSYPALHTLASVYIELGKVEEARQTFVKLLELDNPRELSQTTQYLIGALAEAYGLNDVARAAYEKVEAPKEPNPIDTYWLAKKRLTNLTRKTTERRSNERAALQ